MAGLTALLRHRLLQRLQATGLAVHWVRPELPPLQLPPSPCCWRPA